MEPLTTYKRWINQEIKKQSFGKEPESLYEPIRYLMALGGKRLRPLLVLLAYGLYKKNVKTVVPYAVAVEAFHNFTLMHDDIMDKAPLRRGNSTVHEKWNVNTAILSGDVMLVKVYDLFLPMAAPTFKAVVKSFNACAVEVCEGQQRDMEFETMPVVTEEEYINMIRQKTAVLLGFSLELGARLATATPVDTRALREFGINIGIGFQLMDDLLDAYADPGKFGKQVGGDILANKKTFLLITALQHANKKQQKDLQHWMKTDSCTKTDKINGVLNIYNELNVRDHTQRKIDSYFKKGFKALEKVKWNRYSKHILKNFTEELISRQH